MSSNTKIILRKLSHNETPNSGVSASSAGVHLAVCGEKPVLPSTTAVSGTQTPNCPIPRHLSRTSLYSRLVTLVSHGRRSLDELDAHPRELGGCRWSTGARGNNW